MVAGYGFGSGPQLHLLSKSCLGSLGPPCHYLQAWGRCGFPPQYIFVKCCRRANVSAQVEVGSGFGHDKCNTRPADVLVPNWSLGKPAAFDHTITSPLNPSILSEAGVTAGSAALVAECCKHDMNDPKCSELGWKCTPLAVETYGCWGAESRETLSRLATCLAIPMKSKATASIYGRLSLTLVRPCARALLSRAGPSLVITG